MAYTSSKKITIDHTKVGASDSAAFPFLFSGVYADMAGTGHGGVVTSSSGFDIIFTSDAAGTSLLSWEIETYDTLTGTVNFWVRIPTLSHTADTVIYVFYGNSAITTFQGGATGAAWNAAFQGVWHLPNGSSLSVADSTSNAVTTTNHSAGATTGQIDGAASFVAASSQFIDAALTNSASGLTVSAWIKTTTTGLAFIVGNDDVSTHRSFQFRMDASTNFLDLVLFTSVSGVIQAIGTTSLIDGVYHHVVGTFDEAHAVVYVDGVLQKSTAGTLTLALGSGHMFIGALNQGAGLNFWNGSIDEVRVASVARSADWILAEYNNQHSPSTFYTLTSIFVPQVGAFAVGF